MSRLCAVILFIICFLIVRRLYYNSLQVADSSSKKIIVVNLRAFNQSIPDFIAEDEDNRGNYQYLV